MYTFYICVHLPKHHLHQNLEHVPNPQDALSLPIPVYLPQTINPYSDFSQWRLVLPMLEKNRNRILQNVLFGVWTLSFNLILDVLPCFHKLQRIVFFYSRQYPIPWMWCDIFTHCCANRHWVDSSWELL